MKKRYLLLIAGIIFLTGCSKSNVQEINYKEFNQKIKNKETFILEVVQDGCHYCDSYAPKFEKILKENDLEAFKINLAKMNKEDEIEFKTEFFIDGTPTTIFIKDGFDTSVMQRIVGDAGEEKIISTLKLNGYKIKEEK